MLARGVACWSGRAFPCSGGGNTPPEQEGLFSKDEKFGEGETLLCSWEAKHTPSRGEFSHKVGKRKKDNKYSLP